MGKRKTVLTEGGVSSDAETSRDVLRRIISRAGQWKQKPYRDDDELAERCELYKNLIAAQEPAEVPTAESFAMFLGVSFYKLRKLIKGDGCTERAMLLIQDVMTWMSNIWTQSSVQSLIGNVDYIWYGKNWFEMREPDSRISISALSPLKELPSLDQLQAKYADLPEVKLVKEKPPEPEAKSD